MAQRKQTFILINDRVRENALLAIAAAGEGSAVTIGPKTRSGDQNAKFHAICTDIANSHMTWAGKRRDAEAWKVLLVSAHTVATKNDPGAPSPEIVPGLEGEFVNIRESTARMTISPPMRFPGPSASSAFTIQRQWTCLGRCTSDAA